MKKKYLVRSLYLLALLELCIISFFAITHSPTIQNTMVLATTIKPEPLTELYFENNTKLPHTINASHPYAFTFTVHNLEDRDMKYPYKVYADLGTERLPIEEGIISLKKDGYKSVSERFATTSLNGRIKIVVELTDQQQQIDFWVEGKTKNEK